MRRSLLPSLLLAALALAGCQGSSAPAPSLKVSDGSGNTGPLRLGSLTRLSIESAYVAAPGQHAQRIDITDSNGVLYASLRAKVSAGLDGAVATSQGLEVRGTLIDGYHMVGTWKFTLAVDDGPPIATAAVDITD
jgi:hypothetical protein